MGDIITRSLKNGRIAFYARYVEIDGKRTSKATKAKNIEAAQKWLERAETRVAGGLPGDVRAEGRAKAKAEQERKAVEAEAARNRLTVRQLCEKFCGYIGPKHADNFTAGAGGENSDPIHYRRGAWSVLKCHVLPTLEALDAATLRRSDIVKLADVLNAAGKSAFIVSRTLRLFGRVFNWAIEREFLTANPVHGVKKPKTTGSTKHYSDDEVAKLLAWAAEHDPDLHGIIAFAFYTACRKGEIAALRWSDIDWQGARIVVQRSWKRQARKSGQPVVVNMHPHLAAILSALQSRTAGEGEELVFPDSRGLMRDKYDLWGLAEAITATKVRRFRYPLHAFRHTHATNLAIGGAGLTAIRDALGQSTLHMAANYTHLAAVHVRAHVEALPTLGPTGPTVASLDEARKRRMDTDGIRGKKRADENSAKCW